MTTTGKSQYMSMGTSFKSVSDTPLSDSLKKQVGVWHGKTVGPMIVLLKVKRSQTKIRKLVSLLSLICRSY